MSKATFPETTGQESTKPVEGGSLVSADMRNALAALFQGDLSALRPRAQSTPDMTIHVNPAVINSYYEQVWGQGGSPFSYAGGNTGSMSAPASNPRYDIVYLNSSGSIAIITGTESGSPSIPWASLPSDGIAIAVIYHRTTATKIVNYEDKDANTNESYIALDCRPFLNLGGASATDVATLQDNMALMFFLFETQNSLSFQLMEDGVTDTFTDETGIATGSSSNQTYDSTNKLYSPTRTDQCSGGSAVSGGDATSTTDLLPLMTSNTTPSGVCSASDEAVQPAWKFADNDTGTGWNPTNAAPPHWWKYDWGSGNAKVITGYSIVGNGGDTSSSPRDFKLQGSNDNSNWTDLDTRTSITWTLLEKKTYSFSNTTAYRYYRFYESANANGGGYSHPEIELFAPLTKDNAFDDSNSTYWASSQTNGSISGAAYIGYNFGSGKTIKAFSIKQHAANQAINSVKVQRSSDGSSWTDVQTVSITAGTTKETQNITNSTSAQYWRLLANAENTSGSWEVEEVEFFEAPLNMTLISAAFTAAATPTSARVVIFEEDVDSVTINTDLLAYASRDGGTTWTQITLVNEGTYASSKNILAGSVSISAQPSGTSMKYKLVTANNKNLKIHGASLLWK